VRALWCNIRYSRSGRKRVCIHEPTLSSRQMGVTRQTGWGGRNGMHKCLQETAEGSAVVMLLASMHIPEHVDSCLTLVLPHAWQAAAATHLLTQYRSPATWAACNCRLLFQHRRYCERSAGARPQRPCHIQVLHRTRCTLVQGRSHTTTAHVMCAV
jgi:hypothetical protein